MTCCPFQYLTKLSDCSVVMMSFCVMDVMALRSLMLRVPLNDKSIKSWSVYYKYDYKFRLNYLKSLRISRRTQDQYER